MRVEFERSGGFAGLIMRTEVDTSQLSADEAAQLQKMLSEANFFKLPSRLPSSASNVDRFQYNITVHDNNRTCSVQASESALPPELRPLVDWLTAQARKPRS
ncbi:MAG TPA: protealysin inhibitor emfourin [Chloroflexia bacterium]|nr:protealysin inhibitor emfourin [Chloroflexia bacterium]